MERIQSGSGPTAEAVDAYLGYLKRRGRSPKTLVKYRRLLADLAEWARECSPAELTAADLEFGFLASWEREFERQHGRGPSPQSLRALIGVLSSFYGFLTNFGFLVDTEGRPVVNPALALEAPVIKQRANDWLRPTEDRALLDLPLRPHEEILVWFLRWTGLRLSEALALRIPDVDIVEATITVSDSLGKARQSKKWLNTFDYGEAAAGFVRALGARLNVNTSGLRRETRTALSTVLDLLEQEVR